MKPAKQQLHFVLVHGVCHGAWCWYKLKPMLEAAGHRVTALDLTASGINPTKIQDIYTMAEYSKPLLEFMASIPEGEKVILVGHSFGGISLGVAMDTYPEKISVAVFLTAFMPDSIHKPSFVLEKFNEQTPPEAFLDTEFVPYGTPEKPGTSFIFGPKFIESMLYQLSPPEDLELAKALLRPSSVNFQEDLTKKEPFSNERFESVKRAYIVCDEDKTIPLNFQKWLIQNIGVSQVIEIKNVDHMAMLSRPQQVCQSLLKIAKELL